MKLSGFQIQMYKSIVDSGWIEVTDLTALVGKNEAGKTSLLKALHKLNPFQTDPYSLEREWPRGRRKQRSNDQIVCIAEFELSQSELERLGEITDQDISITHLKVSRNYGGILHVRFPDDMFPEKLHPNQIDEICSNLPQVEDQVGDKFREAATDCTQTVRRLAGEGRFSGLRDAVGEQIKELKEHQTPDENDPKHTNENKFLNDYEKALQQIEKELGTAPTILSQAHEYIVDMMPTFIYMSDYRAFTGTAQLDLIQQRRNSKSGASEEDKTLMMIMELSGLELDEEVKKGNSNDREQRQYDLDDASATLTNEIAERWRQRRYEVEFRADGQLFYTFVKDEQDPSLIKLEERSKGFQWFFSFDLMFMYESKGTFENCVLLLDEPGLHLHPGAQKDLLIRLENYAKDNVLIYTTHLPFMLDLRRPERIRILSETDAGTVVNFDLTQSQPEAKFVLQAALGMGGNSSYLVANRNLVVEGVDDYWYLTELSNLLIRSGDEGLLEDIFITPAGGASEVVYIATFMIGQELDVVALFDSDIAGKEAYDRLVKNWLTRYNEASAQAMMLGNIVSSKKKEFSIEDIFSEDFYLKRVYEAYEKQLRPLGIEVIALLEGDDQLVKKVERTLSQHDIKFNKGRVAKLIKRDLLRMQSLSDLSKEVQNRVKDLIGSINNGFQNDKE